MYRASETTGSSMVGEVAARRGRATHTLAALLLLAGAGHSARAWGAEAAGADDAGWRAVLGTLRAEVEVAQQLAAPNAPRYTALGAGAALDLLGGTLEVASGARLALGAIEPNPGASLFVRSSLCAVGWGSWQPAVGLELELTSATQPDVPGKVYDLDRRYALANQSRHWRATALTALLRFRVDRLSLTAGVLRFGTALSDELGARVYVGVGIVNLGWRL